MSNENVMAETQSAHGIRKLIAAQEAKRRGLLRTEKSENVKKMAEILQGFPND